MNKRPNTVTEKTLRSKGTNATLERAKKDKDFSKELAKIPLLRTGLPYTYKIGRPLIAEIVAITNELLAHLRESPQGEAEKYRGEYAIRRKKGEAPIIKQVGKMEIYSSILAMAKRLSNDSHLAGKDNEEAHSGLLVRNSQKQMESWLDFYNNSPIIKITMNELCEFLGDTGSESREAMNAALHLMSYADLNNMEWKFAYLLQSNKEKKRRKANEPVSYVVLLNPIFANIAHNFGTLAQDAGKRLTEVVSRNKTAEDILLLAHLSAQDKRNPFRRDIATLVEELDIKVAFEKDRGRTEEKLYKLFQHRKEEGIIEHFDFIGKGADGEDIILQAPFDRGNRPLKIVAYFNQEYGKEPKEKAAPNVENGARLPSEFGKNYT